ncbi:helix-turn-helix transcriptional regulator [Streptomyces sp. NPDC005329]|uniref:helix-turn-helix domain-containing protein n=1 Tax=Streptomyces sp. NPDC005329 TaxID=3157034 RepID=UPI0033BAF5B2
MAWDQGPGRRQAERDVVPPRIGSRQQFREELTRLRTGLGVSLAQLEQASQRQSKRLPPATVSNVLSRDRLPEWEFVADFLAACGLDEAQRGPWQQVWRELAAASPAAGGPDAAAAPPAPVPAPSPPPAVGPPPAPSPPAAHPGKPPAEPPAVTPPADGGRWRAWRAGLAPRRAAVAVCAALALAAAMGVYAFDQRDQNLEHGKQQQEEKKRQEKYRTEHCGTLNPALVTEAGGECTGVTDGLDRSDVFGSALEPVLTAIGAENHRATRDGQYVTIAFLAPLTSVGKAGKAKDLTLDQFVGEVEGAYTAVERANTDDGPLKIRLVLANMGSGELHWKDTVAALDEVDNLVAVTGMGLSQQESVDAARALSGKDIPMVADLITADGFDTTGAIDSPKTGPERINGLVRVTLTNAAQLGALGAELDGDTRTAALVRTDVTPNGTRDFYTDSLYRDFRTVGGLKKHLDPAADFFFDPRGGAASILDTIGQNLCNTGHPVDTVYFAAREKYLPDFLQALSRRSCHRLPVTVVAGSDTAALDPKALAGLNQEGEAPIAVLYASLPSATRLRGPGNSDHSLYDKFLDAFTGEHHGQKFPAGHATRGYWPVLAHDAVLTATTAVRNATTPTAPRPNRYAVLNHLYALTDGAVPAATGRFGIDTTGNRTKVPITIHRLGTASS